MKKPLLEVWQYLHRKTTSLFRTGKPYKRTEGRYYSPNIHFVIAETYFDKGLYARAIEELIEGLKVDPGNFNAHILLGTIYLIEKSFGKAIIVFQEALIMNQNYFSLYTAIWIYILYVKQLS